VKVALVAALIASLMAAGAALAAGPKITAPRKAHAGAHLTARATGLSSGRYALTISADQVPGERTACVARIGKLHRASHGSVLLGGRIPHHLTCWENDNVRLGTVKLTRGAYHLIVAVPDGPSGFSVRFSFARRAIKITR
jgi:hypothetical protein